MKLTVLLFAHLKEKAGVRAAEVEVPAGASAGAVKARLGVLYPALKPALANILMAVNHEYVSDDTLISEGAEIALFPPVSGG
jgi:molybdopterin converting factor subunit 1